MNTLIIPIKSADEYELVIKFIETNLNHNFSWTNIKTFFFEDNDTFKSMPDCNALALDHQYPYPFDTVQTQRSTENEYKEIEPTVEALYMNIGWLDAA